MVAASGIEHVAAEDGADADDPLAPGGHRAAELVADTDRVRRRRELAVDDVNVGAAEAAGASAYDCLSTRTAVPFYAAMGFSELGGVEITLAAGIVFPAIRMGRAV